MKKKIAIITLTRDFNYGNRLQNYALQQLIQKYGFKAETLFNETWSFYLSPSNFYYNLKKVLKRVLLFRIRELEVAKKFDDFNKKFICWGASINSNSNLENISKDYDYIITGSDQVWNPFWGFITDKEFLVGVENDKSIAYAASFGVDAIPDNKVELYKRWLNEIKYISVREKKAAQIIDALIGRKVQIVVDPTMCISRNQWEKLEKRIRYNFSGKYILVYMLGFLSDEEFDKIERYSRERNLEVVCLTNFHVDGQVIGPREFLGLVHNADKIITDSFHGTVFSIIYNKDFLCLQRIGQTDEEQMNSRITTLLEIFGLFERYKNTDTFLLETSDINWEDVNERLRYEQEKAIQYLMKALNIL